MSDELPDHIVAFRAEVTQHLDCIIKDAPPELVIEFLRDSAAMILTSLFAEDPLHARQLMAVYAEDILKTE